MMDLCPDSAEPMSWVTTVAGSPHACPRFVLDLHTLYTDVRIEFPDLDALATFYRAALALYRDANRLTAHGHPGLQTRLFEHKPFPVPIPLWARSNAPTA